MQIMITDNDFDQQGTPRGPLRQIVLKWADDLANLEANAPVVTPLKDTSKVVDTPNVVAKPADTPHQNVTPITKYKSDPPPPPAPAVKSESKSKKRKRRTKEEIEAADDAACQLEILAAKKDGREPLLENLPKDTQNRVGKNPKSWIDPKVYEVIMSDSPAVPLEEDPHPDYAPLEETPESPATDFSEFLDDGPSDPKTDAAYRFEIGTKLVQLRNLSPSKASAIVNAWKMKYETTSTPNLPADKLAFELGQIEAALDSESK